MEFNEEYGMGELNEIDIDYQATTNPLYQENAVVKMSFEFALYAMQYAEALDAVKKYTVSRQLLRSATSVGANIREAQNAESKADCIHKMKIANKELYETEYWLLLCEHSKSYHKPANLLTAVVPLRKILTKIISTSKNNYPSKTPKE